MQGCRQLCSELGSDSGACDRLALLGKRLRETCPAAKVWIQLSFKPTIKSHLLQEDL